MDFIKEVVGRPTVLVGNSIGSLACMVASAGIVNIYQCAELYSLITTGLVGKLLT